MLTAFILVQFLFFIMLGNAWISARVLMFQHYSQHLSYKQIVVRCKNKSLKIAKKIK